MSIVVSILIPVFNRGHIIAETLISALAQSYTDIEVVVVDNASTDKTWDVIQSFAKKDARIKAYRNDFNIGPVRNWLRCVDEANGEYGKILWSDDLIAPDFLEKTMPYLKNDDVAFVYTGANIFSCQNPLDAKTSYLLPKSGKYSSHEYIKRAIYNKNVPASPGCAIFRMGDIRKNLLLDVPNKINSDFSMHAIGNDLLLFLLTAKDYTYFAHIAEPLSFFRAHEGSISISSASGKLPLHYALARAYFVENYFSKETNYLATKIQLMLWRFKDAHQYGMHGTNDFFTNPVKISKFCLISQILHKILSLPIRVLGGLIK